MPTEFANTNRKESIEKLMEQLIWSGWKKIILIGSPSSIQRGFNVLMQASEECRNSLEVGFWPLHLYDLPLQMLPRYSQLGPILQVFKTAHTLPVDVIKLQYLTPQLETSYYWKGLGIMSRISSADTRIYLDDQDFLP